MFQNIIEVIILSAIQGISEFLPISSSAHLILVSSLYEFKSSSLLIDISLHLGSLFAIVYFFRNELLDVKNNKRLFKLNHYWINSCHHCRIYFIFNRSNLQFKKYKDNCLDNFNIWYHFLYCRPRVVLIKRFLQT